MKPTWLPVILLSFISLASMAQNSSYTVEGSGDINKSIAPAQRFQYPAFVKGHLVFRDGKETFAPLNYNWVLGDMQFISMKGDTLSLANEAALKYITINSDSFFYDNLYLQLIDGNGNVKLAKNEKLKLSNVKKIGAFDTRTSGVEATTYSSVNVNSSNHSLDAKQELTVRTNATYYLGDSYNHFVPFTKKNLLKRFSKNSGIIEEYLQTATPNFNKEDDLKRLLTFLKDVKD